jgi:hypothetical protein
MAPDTAIMGRRHKAGDDEVLVGLTLVGFFDN